MSQSPGRSCPLHYRYAPASFATAAPPSLTNLDVLYVVGGLYGNEQALACVLDLFERERGRKQLVFNGDFHWFDADPERFARVQRQVLQGVALRGNVETELASAATDDAEQGCGCAYPEWVGDDVVTRSNRILARLRGVTTAEQRQQLAALPMALRADVGPLQLGVVHGDAESLAGWGFAQEHLQSAAHRAQVQAWFAAAEVDAFASTHTCLPVFQALQSATHTHWVFNNGAAGMPNFQGDAAGLLTRVALAPFEGSERRFGTTSKGVHVDAIALAFDRSAFERDFTQTWPEGSDAHASYFQRIQQGPAYTVAQCLRHALV